MRASASGRLVALLATLALSVPCTAADPAPSGVKSVDEAWVKAMKANDLEAVLRCYAKDAVLWLPAAAEANGEQAIRASYEGFFGVNTVTDVTLTATHYTSSGSLSAGWGRFSLSMKPKAGGEPVVMNGRFTAVAAKKGGRWVYVADHASSDPTPSQVASR